MSRARQMPENDRAERVRSGGPPPVPPSGGGPRRAASADGATRRRCACTRAPTARTRSTDAGCHRPSGARCGGAMTRPWRLTRRKRVEMEAALASLRARVETWPTTDSLADGMRALRVDGWWLMSRYSLMDDRWLRLLRARVAIALRAALRADEDARCEEALRRAGCGEETGSTPGDGWDVGYDDGAQAAVDALREWRALDRGWNWTVPLALWEVVR